MSVKYVMNCNKEMTNENKYNVRSVTYVSIINVQLQLLENVFISRMAAILLQLIEALTSFLS